MKRHILCIGDSNTHGYCADPADCADGGNRFNEEERWTCLLQKTLGEAYLVTEEGLSGRTTVFPDPLHESMDTLPVLYALLKSHEAVDLLILMLGTNDTKERLGCHFLDAAGCEFNRVDFMHLSRRGHAQLAERLAALVPGLMP